MTASTFLLHRDAGHWIVGLIWHDRLGGHMPAGGHGEVGEECTTPPSVKSWRRPATKPA
ncbi:hypothetical protein ACFQ0M_49710 [Kitasatospora aburaviensis]